MLYNLNQLIPIQHNLSVLLGSSGSGKTYFIRTLLNFMKSSSIYVYTKEPNDYPQPTKFLNQINFEHEHFVKRFASDSIIIIDDFSWNPSHEQRNHLARLINFTLRHKK